MLYARGLNRIVNFYLDRSEKPVDSGLKAEEPRDDAPPVARNAERLVVVTGSSNAERRVHESDVGQPEQRDAHPVGGLRRRLEDTVARVPVGSPFLYQSRVVSVVQHH